MIRILSPGVIVMTPFGMTIAGWSFDGVKEHHSDADIIRVVRDYTVKRLNHSIGEVQIKHLAKPISMEIEIDAMLETNLLVDRLMRPQ